MEWTVTATVALGPRTRRQGGSGASYTHFVLLLGTLLRFLLIPPVAVQDPGGSSSSLLSPLQRLQSVSAFGGAGGVPNFDNVQSVIHEIKTKCDRWGLNCSRQFTQRVRRDASNNGQYSTIEDVTDSASSSRLNFFNYGLNLTTTFPSKRKSTSNGNAPKLQNARDQVTETTTPPWDRSLIPNSFFSLAQSDIGPPSKSGGNTQGEGTSAQPDLDSAGSAERARRSPSSKRAALHYGPPVPMRHGAHGPRFRPLPPPPMSNRINYVPPQPMQPPARPMTVSMQAPAPAPAPVPVPVPMPLPYTQHQNDYDYTGYGYGYGSAPEQQSHSHNRGVKRPAPPHMVRRMPAPSYGASRPMPRPLGALPRPRPKGRPGHMPRPPQYSYPKDAANIQDILSYFKDNDNRPPAHYKPLIRAPGTRPRPQIPLMPDRPSGGSEFSKELDDVQTSLMKDIREFAKRPAIMGSPTPEQSFKPPSPYKQSYSSSDDGSYEPRPKPVREMSKLNSKNRFEESAERAKGDRYRLKDRDQSHEYRNRFKSYGADESEERPSRPLRDYGYVDKHTRSKSRAKYPSSSSYHLQKKPSIEDVTNSEEWEHYLDRSPSIYTQTTKPVVLKSPYGPYRSEAEMIKASRPYQKYWDSGERDSYSAVPRVRAPSITYSPSKSKYKNISPEVLEDIVEIHTDPSYRSESIERLREGKERKAQLHRLYLEYLERKLEAERLAALALEPPIPPTTPKSNPMRMKIHIYPNENVKVAGESTGANGGNFYYSQPTPTVSYSSNNPSIVSPPTRQFKSSNTGGHVYVGSGSHHRGVGVTGPQMGVDKNKNVVLHLHVHRRQGMPQVTGGMLAEASEIYTSTTKPLTYNEIFDEYQDLKHPTHKSSSSIDIADDKSVSMELPIQDEKIDDVLHTLLQLRKQRNTQS